MTTRIITLTNHPPVEIDEAEWPVIAESLERQWDGEHEFQSFFKSKAFLKVRQHQDGRAIVYGGYDHEDRAAKVEEKVREGKLLAEGATPVALCNAIRDVAGTLMGPDYEDIESNRHALIRLAMRACLADLPPVRI